MPPPGSKEIGDRAFIRYGVATVVMQILLMVGRFDVDGGAELTLVDVNIDIQEGDMGLGVTVRLIIVTVTHLLFVYSNCN